MVVAKKDKNAMVAAEFHGRFHGPDQRQPQGQPGYLFAALSGSKTDGARFVADAVARGATAVLARPEAGR